MKIFENICRLNTGTKGKCCDPNDTAIEEINSSIPSNYTSVKIENHRNNEKIIKVCPEGENCPGYSPPNAYIKCKLSDYRCRRCRSQSYPRLFELNVS